VEEHTSLVEGEALVPVLRRWFTGHYGHYARGYLDVIRDIALTD
jgi:hypothetical protein